MSDANCTPNSLPETLDELALLIRTAIEAGFNIAREHAVADRHRTPQANSPYIDWSVADARLAEVLAATKAP